MMWVSKVPNYDAYGLFRALHSHNPLRYSHIVGLSSHFYVYAPLRSEQNIHWMFCSISGRVPRSFIHL